MSPESYNTLLQYKDLIDSYVAGKSIRLIKSDWDAIYPIVHSQYPDLRLSRGCGYCNGRLLRMAATLLAKYENN